MTKISISIFIMLFALGILNAQVEQPKTNPVKVQSSNSLKSQNPVQTEISKSNLYYEFGANYIVSSTSLNYERLVKRSKSDKLLLYGRAGLGGAQIYWGNSGWGGLAALTMLTGNKNAHFEASTGLFSGWQGPALAPGSVGNLFYVPILDLGFRYQKPGKGFLFRAKAGTLGIGIGAGYSF